MVAELAAELGKDQKDFLLEMIGPPRIVDPRKTVTNEPVELRRSVGYLSGRYRAVRVAWCEIAAKEAGWGRKLPKGHGHGHRGSAQLPDLRRYRRRGCSGRQGQRFGSARGYGDRLPGSRSIPSASGRRSKARQSWG